MAELPLIIKNGYSFNITIEPPVEAKFKPVLILPMKGIETERHLQRRVIQTIRQACPLGESACQACVDIVKRDRITVVSEGLECLSEICPLEVGAPEGYELDTDVQTITTTTNHGAEFKILALLNSGELTPSSVDEASG